jgi:hypothetical protein
MTDKNFFELLKNKISALRPSETHQADDWAVLAAQLDEVLPQKKERRRLFILPFLLFAGLLLSNGVWWAVHHNTSNNMQHLENQAISLRKYIDSIEQKQIINRTDTVWRTIYIEKETNQPIGKTTHFNKNKNSFFEKMPLSTSEKVQESNAISMGKSSSNGANIDGATDGFKTNALENTRQPVWATQAILTKIKPLMLEKIPKNPNFEPKPIIITEKTKPRFLKTPSVKIGLKADFLNPHSAGLTAQTGIGLGVQSSVRFTKHLSIVGAIGMARLDYTATDKDAIIGSPEELPAVVNSPNTTLQMHMKNQGCMHYDLSLRYTFSPVLKIKPFLGAGFAGMTLRPFQMDLQVKNTQMMMVHQSNFEVIPAMQQQKMAHISGGFELPLSRHFSLDFEGYYMRLWKKTVALSPDFIGIRAGIHYGF